MNVSQSSMACPPMGPVPYRLFTSCWCCFSSVKIKAKLIDPVLTLFNVLISISLSVSVERS